MSARKRKSKKQSAANFRQLPEFVFFIDRNLGKHKLAQMLQDDGQQVEVHDDHLPQDAPDEDWIQLVGESNWLAITKDKNIMYRASELEAIKDQNACIFVVRAKNVTAEDVGNILINATKRIKKFAEKTKPPYVAAIYRDGSVKAYDI